MNFRSSNPLISIIIPTYNRAGLLCRSLESLISQSIAKDDYEVIVIDDGSTDETKDVCEQLADELPLFYLRQQNAGISAAKNLGIFAARASILFFFDDDDIADGRLLEEHLKTHETYPQENIAVLGYTTWAPELRINRVMQFVTEIGHFLFSYSHLKDGQECDFTYFWGGRSSCKRSLLVKHGVFDQQFRFGSEDIELGFRLSRFGLKVIFNRQAKSYMLRPVTYEQFCQRCIKQGRSQYFFSKKHNVPLIRQYCMVEKAEGKWRFVSPRLETKMKRVREITALLKNTLPLEKKKQLVYEIGNLYWWTFNALKIKGIIEAMHEDEVSRRDVCQVQFKPTCPVQEDVRFLEQKWKDTNHPDPYRGNILVVDPTLPMYDRASGSLRLFEILKALLRLNYHVTFIARSSEQAEVYVPILQDMGIEVYAGDPAALEAVGVYVIGPDLDLQEILVGGRYDYVILSFWHAAEYYLPLIQKHSPESTIIVDTVDIHFLREIREAELKQNEVLMRKARANKQREIAVYRKADRLWVVTAEDKAKIENLRKAPIDVIPNIHKKIEIQKRFEDTADLLFVGNFQHKPNVDAVVYFCRQIFPLITEELPDVKLYVVGNKPPAAITSLAADNVIITGYVEDLSPHLMQARVSVNPLTYGAGMKGKIGEALSWGLPVVTTPIGAEGMGLVHEKHALIADDAATFATETLRVYRDESLWNRLSFSGRELVRQCWSPEAIQREIEGVLPGCLAAEGLVKQLNADVISSQGKKPGDYPLVSIITLTWNQLEYTKKCLESIKMYTPEQHELIIIDNGSSDATPEFLKRYAELHANVQLILNDENLGFAAGNNRGIEKAQGKYILFLNNDTVVTEGWLSRMIAHLERYPEAGMVGPVSNAVPIPQLIRSVPYGSDLNKMHSFAAKIARKNTGKITPFVRLVGFCLLAKK
ncbi:MAG: glycosyltransferase, partial [Deltaproteobacteria bacterium]|nr:glycosyltransferase [Deltaproteobacteria bacterium]